MNVPLYLKNTKQIRGEKGIQLRGQEYFVVSFDLWILTTRFLTTNYLTTKLYHSVLSKQRV